MENKMTKCVIDSFTSIQFSGTIWILSKHFYLRHILIMKQGFDIP